MFTTYWLLAIFAAHLFATYYLFMFLSKIDGSEPTHRAKVIGNLFAILHGVPQTVLFYSVLVMAMFGCFYPKEQ